MKLDYESDKVVKSMDIADKIGQMFIVGFPESFAASSGPAAQSPE